MKIEVELSSDIVDQLAEKFSYRLSINNEDGQPIKNPMSKEEFIKQVIIQQVFGLLLEDRINQEVDNLILGIKPVLENAIKDQIIVR